MSLELHRSKKKLAWILLEKLLILCWRYDITSHLRSILIKEYFIRVSQCYELTALVVISSFLFFCYLEGNRNGFWVLYRTPKMLHWECLARHFHIIILLPYIWVLWKREQRVFSLNFSGATLSLCWYANQDVFLD